MKNKINTSEMDIKNKKVMLYLTRQVIQLNSKCNNVIKKEKFQRAIAMFTNRSEDFDTIKAIIDWHVQNETKQYLESLKAKRNFLEKHNQYVKNNIPKPNNVSKVRIETNKNNETKQYLGSLKAKRNSLKKHNQYVKNNSPKSNKVLKKRIGTKKIKAIPV